MADRHLGFLPASPRFAIVPPLLEGVGLSQLCEAAAHRQSETVVHLLSFMGNAGGKCQMANSTGWSVLKRRCECSDRGSKKLPTAICWRQDRPFTLSVPHGSKASLLKSREWQRMAGMRPKLKATQCNIK